MCANLTSGNKVTPPLTPIGFFNRIQFRMQHAFAFSLLKVLFRLDISGPLPPEEGAVIIAANHESLLDPVVLQAATTRRIHYLMTSDYYFKPVLNRYSRLMRCIPIMEGNLNREALKNSINMLAHGRAVGIFPQGEIRSGGDLGPGMRGIALIALRSKAPVYPVRIRGTARVLPKGGRFPRLAGIKDRFGEELRFLDLDEKASSSRHRLLESITAELMESINRL